MIPSTVDIPVVKFKNYIYTGSTVDPGTHSSENSFFFTGTNKVSSKSVKITCQQIYQDLEVVLFNSKTCQILEMRCPTYSRQCEYSF